MPGYTAENEVAIDVKYQNSAYKQPADDNYLLNNAFRFNLQRTPTVTYFCQRAAIPQLSFNIIEQPTRFGAKVYKAGTSYEYSELEIEFIVDERMRNWLELHDWMRSLSNAEDASEFIPYEQQTSTAEIIVLTSAYKPYLAVTFKDVFPTSLGQINFDSTISETEPVISSATFRYSTYSIRTLGDFRP
tara:strand:+ start:317 stop:880 length:564 start_codon:yes stop_codon:yes gene_type:complete